MNRRHFLPTVLAGAAVAAAQTATEEKIQRKGRLKQCVTGGVFPRAMPFEDRCRNAARLGAVGFDLIGPKDWPTLKKYGLIPTMYPPGPGGTIENSLNRRENHDAIERGMHAALDEAAAAGCPSVITFSGNRRYMPDLEGLDNSVMCLNKLKAHAEDKGVNICIEFLNSKVNHKDYMFDHAWWGIELCKRVNSPRVKILYDIYHAQIMDGDIIRTIKDNFQYIGHYHTGGNPGRNEIDETQELNYRLIAQTIADLGFKGYVAHEYSPKRDALTSLDQAMKIFDV